MKTDQTATGFSYLIGEEYNNSIAHSKKRKKVVVYFSCFSYAATAFIATSCLLFAATMTASPRT